mmetsp:Transcript_4497/g.10607  ORF Transcript_4497/g.10607 Transcript_4497/m.10607 type:complete len:90 (-) Transcript_4497:882-1151(-)
MANLQAFRAYTNGLTGTIPSEVGLMSALTTLHLATNQLTGSIPVLPASLNICYLAQTFDGVTEQNCFTDSLGNPNTDNAGICVVVNNCI